MGGRLEGRVLACRGAERVGSWKGRELEGSWKGPAW